MNTQVNFSFVFNFRVDSDHGRIQLQVSLNYDRLLNWELAWQNSATMPEPDPFSRRMVRHWGVCIFNPIPGMCYGKTIVCDSTNSEVA